MKDNSFERWIRFAPTRASTLSTFGTTHNTTLFAACLASTMFPSGQAAKEGSLNAQSVLRVENCITCFHSCTSTCIFVVGWCVGSFRNSSALHLPGSITTDNASTQHIEMSTRVLRIVRIHDFVNAFSSCHFFHSVFHWSAIDFQWRLADLGALNSCARDTRCGCEWLFNRAWSDCQSLDEILAAGSAMRCRN